MVGKHIFVRCRNEQNSAGTWTAAITENVVDKDIIRNYIEPRCNMDETFAQNTLMTCPTNNVLRLYYVNGSVLVVTRTYWVTDRITETQGRKGAYSVSYILTEEDVAKFCGDYDGAFDPGCFESYDKLVARTLETPNNRITLSDIESIFSHADFEKDPSILTKCGFTKESFVAFMNGLYDAVENNKQIAVILPKSIRAAWVESGDNSAETLGRYILGILPDFMRINVGMASHWNCQIKDTMVGDMHLIFVHPEKEEDIAILKRDGAHILDLDGGQHTSAIPNIAENYFSFVWDNLGSMSKCEEFWAYCKTNFKKLLRGRPTSASAMESIYLLRETMAENYSNEARCRTALLLVANEFAGAGTKVPFAEEFISEAITKLKLEKAEVEKDVEDAMRNLVVGDPEKTKHQLQEYKILLNSVEQGTASPETISALCGEVLKDDRNVISYYLSYFADKQKMSHDKITLQMTHLVSDLFVTLFRDNGTAAAYELIALLVKIIKNWTIKLIDNVSEWQEFVLPFTEAYAAYLKSDEADADSASAAYDLMLLVFYKADSELKEKCHRALMKEELRLYRNPNALLNNGNSRIIKFADAILNSFDMVLKTNKEAVVLSYERLFRLIFSPVKEVSDKAIDMYQKITSEFLGGQSDMTEKIASTIFKCEESSLSDKPPIWVDEHTERAIVMIEHLNLELFPAYYPGEDRFALLIDHFKNDNAAIYPVFTAYAEKMPFDVRQSLYKVLTAKDMLVRFFVHIMLYTDQDNIRRELESMIGFSHVEMLKSLLTFQNTNVQDEDSANRFYAWYNNDLNNELVSVPNADQRGALEKQYVFIQNELRQLDVFQSVQSRITSVATTTFFEFVYNVFNSLTSETIGKLPLDVINNILYIQSRSTHTEPLTNQNVFELARQLDELIASNDTPRLCMVCEKYINDPDMRGIIRDRLSMQLNANTCGSKLACELYFTMLNNNLGEYPMDFFLERMGYESLDHLGRGNLLVDVMLQLHNDRSSMERDIGRQVMAYLEAISMENPTALLNSNFISRWKQVKNFEYTKMSNFVRIMSRAQSNRTVKFDLRMLLFCVFALIATSLVMSLLSIAFINLGTVSTLITAIVALVVLIVVVLVDVLMFADLLNSKNRRRNK